MPQLVIKLCDDSVELQALVIDPNRSYIYSNRFIDQTRGVDLDLASGFAWRAFCQLLVNSSLFFRFLFAALLPLLLSQRGKRGCLQLPLPTAQARCFRCSVLDQRAADDCSAARHRHPLTSNSLLLRGQLHHRCREATATATRQHSPAASRCPLQRRAGGGCPAGSVAAAVFACKHECATGRR